MSETHYSPESEISPEKLAENVSLLLIKPENSGKTILFPHILENYGLKTERHTTTLTKERIQKMYPDIDTWAEPLQQATYNHLLDKEVEIFLVTHDTTSPIAKGNLVEQVLQLRGPYTSPAKNPPGTLRGTFYGEQHTLPETDITYWENGLHCPRDSQELINNLETFELLERAKELVQETTN